jgi:hypothetical protein
MNSKAFAIFVGAIMVVSAFAGFVLRGSDQDGTVAIASGSDSLETFGVQGRLVDWNFEGLGDVLEISPENTVMAYWVNLTASQNLSSAASSALPEALGFRYGSQIYITPIERLANVYFNGTWTELHWVKPYATGYDGLVIPYDNYMMIPTGSNYVRVFGQPALIGAQASVEQVLDVIEGGLAAEEQFTLVAGEQADLQVSALGSGGAAMPLSGAYREIYLGASSAGDGGYYIKAELLQPQESAASKARGIASQYNLTFTQSAENAEASGQVSAENMQAVLMALLGP